MDDALQKWQKEQPYRPDDPPQYHYGIFDRCRFMMPERDRLATNLFKEATLRSPLGLSVLRDLMALLEKTSEVEFRPGLERDKCLCPKAKKESQDDGETSSAYDWRHIYTCYKQNQRGKYGFAELCFKCNEWIFSEKEWRSHCLRHLKDLDKFPIYFDPLVYSGVLATPGYCPCCLRDERLPPETRMYQYLNRAKWLVHFQKHIDELENCERKGESIATCPHPGPRCPKSFHSILHLRFHLEDIHGIPMGKESKAKRVASERILPSENQHAVKKERSESCLFINITATTMRTSPWRISKTSSCSTTSYSSRSSTWSKKKWSGSETPQSSGSSDAKDDLATDLDFVVIDELDTSIQPFHNDQMPVVDLTLEGEELQKIIHHTPINMSTPNLPSISRLVKRSERCLLCERSFLDEGDLWRHTHRIHHQNEKRFAQPFSCLECLCQGKGDASINSFNNWKSYVLSNHAEIEGL
jgi:hypothetical protein